MRKNGARLTLPRDLQVAYVLGRFGLSTVGDMEPLFWGAGSTARRTFGRLVKLGIARTFVRRNVADPKWYSLTKEGASWVSAESDCDPHELRTFSGMNRVNLGALRSRNRFWVSVILACRGESGVKLDVFRPEWELRREKGAGEHVVPDALLTLLHRAEPHRCCTYLIEFDSGSERQKVWVEKATSYARARAGGALYGIGDWQVLAVVPTLRRARTVAEAVVAGGAGAFTLLGIEEMLVRGRSLERSLYLASALTQAPEDPPGTSLAAPLLEPRAEASRC